MIMVAKNRETKLQSGQALIELIIFLPLIFMLVSMIGGFAGAINGSINQQKITRAYFYFRVQNNSTIPKPTYIGNSVDNSFQNWSKFGMHIIGWNEYLTASSSPVMPCYQISIPLSARNGDQCEERYTTETTQFIRVGTVYGVCGGTYAKHPSGGSVFLLPDANGAEFNLVVDRASCLIQ